MCLVSSVIRFMSIQLPAIIVVVPLIGSFCVFVSGWWMKRAGFPLALGALGICTALSAIIFNKVLAQGGVGYRMGGWAPPWGIEFQVDHLGAYMLVVVTGLSLLTAIYAKRPVAVEIPDRVALFWCLYLLLVTGLIGIIITGDMFNLFVLLEVVSLTGYALVGIGRGQALLASFRYLIIGTIGASFYLIGIGYLYVMTGSLNMADLSAILPPLYSTRAVQTAFVFIVIGFAIKIALFPLHAWQPDAYTYAPSAVTVIISTAVAKTATYALIRLIFSVFSVRFVLTILPVFDLLCWVAALAMIAGSIFAIRQTSFKRMLAYSSIANVGYIVLAVGLAPATRQGLTPAVMHILNHAVIKGCMFMAACAFIYQFDLWDIRRFEGLGRRMPWTCMALLLAILAMIGMPPSAGFVTKWYLFLAVLEAEKYAFIAVIFCSTLLMIVYFWRLVETMYIRPTPVAQNADIHIQEVPASMLVPCVMLGGLTFALGIAWMSGIMTPVLDAVNTTFGLGVR
jgi:multicomponent Na+:H+ antiporter subunit D